MLRRGGLVFCCDILYLNKGKGYEHYGNDGDFVAAFDNRRSSDCTVYHIHLGQDEDRIRLGGDLQCIKDQR